MRIFSHAGFRSSLGQYQGFVQDYRTEESAGLEAYWYSVILKSGSIYRAGTAGGAAAGTRSKELVRALGDYGNAIGVIRQVIDDCRDSLSDSKTSSYEASLPLLLRSLYVETYLEGDTLQAYSAKSVTGETKSELFSSITGTGVPEVITDVLQQWQQIALERLAKLEQNEQIEILKEIALGVLTL
jgi:geranylgeranyl pyrophosphate synthase